MNAPPRVTASLAVVLTAVACNRSPTANCGPAATALTIGGKTVCAPTPSGDTRRFATAASLAAFSGRPYSDVVNDFVRIADPNGQGRLPGQPAPGPLQIESSAPIAAMNVSAPPGKVISRLTLKNEGQQTTRILVDCGHSHLDFVLAAGQQADTASLLTSAPASTASILIAGPGSKRISGVGDVVLAAGPANDCLLFEKWFDCNFCAGSRCRAGTGGEEASGECKPKTTARCLLIYEEPTSCDCK